MDRPATRHLALALALIFLGVGSLLLPTAASAKKKRRARKAPTGCPAGMARIQRRFCIDRHEASMDVVNKRGKTARRHSPYHQISPGQRVRARSRRGVVPQAYVTQQEATIACETAGKRLCSDEEWLTACKGKQPTTYPYGKEHKPKRCNDHGVSSLHRVFGKLPKQDLYGYDSMNDPRLNRLSRTLAKTGSHARCKNSYGIHDMVGNLHEWTANPRGVFRGGYYLDTEQNGSGCDYKTSAHNTLYSDYSIGFRCCSRLGGEKVPKTIRVAVTPGSRKAKDFERKKAARIARKRREAARKKR